MDNRRQPGGTIANASMPPMGPLVVQGVKSFAKHNPIITSTYLFGIVVLLTVGTGTKLTFDQQNQYDRIMSTIDLDAEYDAASRYAAANNAYYHSKGWFSCDSYCQRNKKRMENSKKEVDAVRAEGNARMSDAKKVAGLFSEVGVRFWLQRQRRNKVISRLAFFL
mmetsp:Transcript_7116/g.15428  ORF Transcript_7116/g.15428 Transcript_7116/m.15428 type:complete len:165 (+) Transcript_7116:174-668(+)